jgi:8-oxo-dGTP diphosphatase
MGRMRAGVILVERDRVAVIERVRRSVAPYHLLPGGTVEPGESAAEAAAREAYEELGLSVRLGPLAATVHRNGNVQQYFFASVVGGRFGSGTGAELASPVESESGSYRPVWLPTASLVAHDVRPGPLAELLQSATDVDALRRSMEAAPVVIHE